MARKSSSPSTPTATFGHGLKPSERPSKVCPVCGRPFAWRKKWERDWDSVKYCSDRCRTQGKKAESGAR